MSITLYTDSARISPYVLTAFAALREKQLEFTLRDVNLTTNEQKEPAFLSRSLTGKVPALEHDGLWLTESLAIAEYLAETFPFPDHARIFPADLKERARCRQIMMWLRTELLHLRRARPTSMIFMAAERARAEPLGTDAELAAAELVRVASQVIRPGRPTLFDAWCIADVDLGLSLMRLHALREPLPAALAEYAEAQWARPSVRAFVELPRPETLS